MPIEFDGPNSKVSADTIAGQGGSTITIQSGHNLSGGGSGLTGLNATNLGSGTVPTARLGTGTANSGVFLRGDGTWDTAGSTSASDLTSGTLPMARLSGTLPALNGSALTNLPASGVADMYMTTHFSRDMTAASGTQDITGFGFNPTHIILYIAVEGRKECCFGQFGDGRQRSFSTTEANNQHLSTGNVIRLYTTYSGTNQHGSISFITDGFRITWTKNGSPTGTAYGWSTGWRAV